MAPVHTFNLALFSALGSFLFGYDSGVMTDVIASQHFLKYFNTTKSSPILGSIVAVFAAGAVFGALMGGWTMEKLGRRRAIQIGACICIVGGVLQAAAVHLSMMLIGRLVTGWAVGVMSTVVPVYQGECAHPKSRGFIVGLAQQMIGFGFIASTWIGYGAHHIDDADNNSFPWRFPLAFQVVPALLLAGGLMWFPESPRHLIEIGDHDGALEVLQKLHFDGGNMEWIQAEFDNIVTTLEMEKRVMVKSYWAMFKVPAWRRRLANGVLVQVFTQLTGINVIGYYQTTMYDAMGITGNTKLLVAALYNLVGPIANLLFITLLIDRVGRKKPLLFGTVGITLLLIAEAAINSQNLDGTKTGHSYAGIAMLFLVSIVFSVSFGPVSWIYMSEVMPMQIRAHGNAFATAFGNWGMNVIFSQVSPQGLEDLGWKYYFVFVAFNVCVTAPTVWYFFVETKGLSLEEIDGLFPSTKTEAEGRRAEAGMDKDEHAGVLGEKLSTGEKEKL